MSLNFSTRAADSTDLERIIDLNLKLFKYESAFNDGLNLSWTLSPEGKKYFQKLLRQDRGIIFVAELEGKIIAYLAGTLIGKINYRLEKCFAEIDNMFVLPDYRGQGVGSALIEQFYNWSKEQGVEKILTEINQENPTAQEFYGKNDFQPHSFVLERKVK
jgi:ribosomal protein S18 acetylase RimI-like enzyme